MRATFHMLRGVMRVAVALCCGLCLASAARSATRLDRSATAAPGRLGSPFAIADFDGDEKLDIATVQAGEFGSSETRYWIQFQLSTGLREIFALRAPMGGLHIASRDVNGDNVPDLVVTSAWEHRPVAVLLNDGHGHFTPRDPAVFSARLWEAQGPFARALVQGLEIAAANLPQNTWEACSTTQLFSSRPPKCRTIPSPASPSQSYTPADSVFGRAPPGVLSS